MVSLLELIRQQREQFIPKEVQQRVSQTSKVAQSQAVGASQKAVNVQAKGFFDILPKPADLLLFNRDPRQEKAQTEIGMKPQTQVNSKVKTGIQQAQRSSIQAFIKGNPSISSVFKSFGF